ncbi:electron transfer flavoprotein subunit beta [Actinomycetota bacterium]|nr:electron transfer flavoprotein subunit beta [Actinomycetota bacterium]
MVCVKHVPDIQSARSIGPDGRVVRDGGDGTINELDENALEAALVLAEQVRDGGGDAEVVALTMGPADAQDAVRRGLQLGADTAVHVLDDAAAGSDVFGTATVLAAAVRHLAATAPVDVVLTGMAGLDGLTSLVPAALADLLDLPQLTLADEVTLADGVVTIRRELDRTTEVLRAPLPVLVSVTDRANEPRYPHFKGIMAARKKPVDELTLADLGVDPATVGTAGARTAVLDAAPRPPRAERVLISDEGDAGLRLAAYLVDHRLV